MDSMTYSASDAFFIINKISKSVMRYNFTLAFFKAACHSNPCAVRKQAGSSPYISRHIFGKLLNISASSNVSL